MRSPWQLALASLTLLGAGCRSEASASNSAASRSSDNVRSAPTPAASATPHQRSTAAPAALVGRPWLVDLGAGGRAGDVVTLPLGTSEPRPILVAVHGAGDRPEWACGGWRIGVESYPFVLCPRGLAMGPTVYGWGSTRDIERAVERALDALRLEFKDYLAAGPMVYAGFSQGANFAREFLLQNAERFPVVALAEGGYDFLTDAAFARQFRAAGGRAALLLCGTPACFTTMSRARGVLTNAGLNVLLAGDARSGHNLNTLMQNALRRSFPELVKGETNWRSFEAHRWPLPPQTD